MAAENASKNEGIIITGAGTGIGRLTALNLARAGYRVFAGVLTAEEAESLRSEARGDLVTLQLDITKPEDVAAARKAVERGLAGARLAAVINNAGIVVLSPAEFVPVADLRKNMEVNYFGTVSVLQTFLPLIRASKGRVITVGSISAHFAAPFQGAYVASKAALAGLHHSLRMELGLWGIPVSIIEPGGVATPLWETTQAAAEKRFDSLPPEAQSLYRPFLDAVRAAADKLRDKRVGPEEVYKAIWHALTARRPKSRYLVGPDAKMQSILANFVPDRLRDRLTTGFLGLREKVKASS